MSCRACMEGAELSSRRAVRVICMFEGVRFVRWSHPTHFRCMRVDRLLQYLLQAPPPAGGGAACAALLLVEGG